MAAALASGGLARARLVFCFSSIGRLYKLVPAGPIRDPPASGQRLALSSNGLEHDMSELEEFTDELCDEALDREERGGFAFCQQCVYCASR